MSIVKFFKNNIYLTENEDQDADNCHYLPQMVKVLLVTPDAFLWVPVHPSQNNLDIQLENKNTSS